MVTVSFVRHNGRMETEVTIESPAPAPKSRRGPFKRSPNAAENNKRYRQRLRERESVSLPDAKQCIRCDRVLQANAFSKCKTEKSGLKRACKSCAELERLRRVAQPVIVVEAKVCTRCGETKWAADFAKKSDSPDKLSPHCKGCEKHRFTPWYMANAHVVSLAATKWAKDNPVAAKVCRKVSKQNRRGREARAGKIPAGAWSEILHYFDRRCAYCLRSEDEAGDMTFEHVLPLSRGGTNNTNNIVPACSYCNGRKGAKTIIEFVVWQSEWRKVAA
jgi:hypothetical protein